MDTSNIDKKVDEVANQFIYVLLNVTKNVSVGSMHELKRNMEHHRMMDDCNTSRSRIPNYVQSYT